MATDWRRRAASRVPSLRWRDELLGRREEQLARLREQLRRLEDAQESVIEQEVTRRVEALQTAARGRERTTPSFRQQFRDMGRQAQRAKVLDPEAWHPYRQLKCKLRNYRFAASHGVGVPTVLGAWSSLADIELDQLPDEFALKSDFGSNGRGVMLLRRTGPDAFLVVNEGRTVTGDDVRAHFAGHEESGRVAGPYFAEELLSQEGALLPVDIKIYAYYGDIGQVLLRRVNETEGGTETRYKFLGPAGEDLGDIAPQFARDASIPTPANLGEMLDVSRHLSRALGVPFCRIDLYDTPGGIVLGELTLTPGGPQLYPDDHDELMGAVWRDATIRRDLDLIAGRPFGIIHGTAQRSNFYPADHVSHADDAGPWAITEVPCERWCLGRETSAVTRPVAPR